MNDIALISPISDRQAERLASPETIALMCEEITALPPRPQPRPLKARPGRRWFVSLAVAGALALALVVIGTAGGGGKIGPLSVGPARAQALSFARHGHYLIVIVRNPQADPAEFRAEFARHHLNIKLQMLPVSPSLVGAVVYGDNSAGTNLKTITAVGKCQAPSGGDRCPIGVKVPLDFRGSADIAFGRAARPGEKYVSAGSADAPGEALHRLNYQGQTVATVLRWLHARHVTVPQYRYMTSNNSEPVQNAPANWYVQGAIPWAPHQVLLMVTRTKAGFHPQAPVPLSRKGVHRGAGVAGSP